MRLTGRGSAPTPDGTTRSVVHLPLGPDSAQELRRRLVAEGPLPMAFAIKQVRCCGVAIESHAFFLSTEEQQLSGRSQTMYELDASRGPATARGTYRAAADHGAYYGGHAVQLLGYGGRTQG